MKYIDIADIGVFTSFQILQKSADDLADKVLAQYHI